MKESFDELFNNSTNPKNSTNYHSEYDKLSIKFPDYLQLILLKSKGFQYCLAIGNNKK